MGVHGLWDLLSPVGRRVSVETLAGKRVAIDASIWMIQFMKAMRDEKGEMVRNAHLLGFFRRICKLLFLRTKPVFVFDGGTPALKRRTVIARRKQRENAQAKIRKTAEKLLMNHIKAMRLKMLAEDLKDQKAKNNSKDKEVAVNQSGASGENDTPLEGHNQEKIDELLAASILAEERSGLNGNTSNYAAAIGSDSGHAPEDGTAFLTHDDDGENVEEMIPVRAKRSKNLAENLKEQKTYNYSKGKEVIVGQSDKSAKNEAALDRHKLEIFDEMLVASMLTEDCDGLDGSASTSAAAMGIEGGNTSASAKGLLAEDENDESDEEVILPVSDGNVDPAVLAALPPSMQLDLLVQMREKLMAESRQKYQKVKKAPQKFSELQIEAYLKTVAFRREIDQVQKAASRRGVAGVQTSRIASEANREFIFSSSFSGDKQLLTSGEAEKNSKELQRTEKTDSSLEILNAIASATKPNPVVEPTADESAVNDVQTFLDERGRMRVSRRRAMGICMTRDLERNLELMKEFEHDRATADNIQSTPIRLDRNGGSTGQSHSEHQSVNTVGEFDGGTLSNNSENSLGAETHKSELSQKSENCIKISFDDDWENRSLDGDDEFFSHLVAVEPVRMSSVEKTVSDCEWEEGNVGDKCVNLTSKSQLEVNFPLVEDNNVNDSDLEWEEGIIGKESGNLTNQDKLEANVSLTEDGDNESHVEWEEGASLTTDNTKLEKHAFNMEDLNDNEIGVGWSEGTTFLHKDASEISANVPKTTSKGSAEEEAALQEAIKRSLEDLKVGKMSLELEKSWYQCNRPSQGEGSSLDASPQLGSVLHDNGLQSFVAESDGANVMAGKSFHTSISPIVQSTSAVAVVAVPTTEPAVFPGTKENAQISNLANSISCVPTHVTATDISSDSVHLAPGDEVTSVNDGALMCNSLEASDIAIGQAASIMEERAFHTDVERNMAEENIALVDVRRRGSDVEMSTSEHEDGTIEHLDASLEDEFSVLGQEYKNLGDEQRKLERNADSVNTEMFVECQELLQMFGLPYIIAPMEAEAQCAYMELANLVDGVVTDDSDVFLFGARSVYKNIFDDRKYVETYFMKDIESELGLNREKLIRMALLLGSDYTEGVSGIGIVNAIEVVNAFPEEDGLLKFREWLESPDPAILGKMGAQPGLSSKNKGPEASKSGLSYSKSNMEGFSPSDGSALNENEDNQATDDSQNIKQFFMDKHRNVSKNWHIPASFPSDAVISAYTAPQVDKSTDPFAWGKPDIFVLRRLCWEKFGWASQKADELLQPVLKEYNKHETQLRLEAFYSFNERFAKIRSKRIKQAVKGITGKRSLELADTDDLQRSPGTMKEEKVHTSNKKSKRENPLIKRRESKDSVSSGGGRKGLSAVLRRSNDAGRSKLRGKQSRKTVRSQRKANTDSTDDGTGSHGSDSSCDKQKIEEPTENQDFPYYVRRSKRARKVTNYSEKDEESDEPSDSLNLSKQTSRNNEAAEQKLLHNQCVPRDDADISRERDSTSEDPPPEDSLAGDYLVTGGGFCGEEDKPETEHNRVGLIQSEDDPTNYDKEYLQLGGGFCVDENDEGQDLQERDGTTAADIAANVPVSSDEADETRHAINQKESVISQACDKGPESDLKLNAGDEHETRDFNPSNVAENNQDDTSSTVNAFRALPYLKRKRRKT